MNRKGFTLMELLLVVAVLAIVAAAAAPTFFGGAQEAMNEARKSSFMSAYQNTVSGVNIYLSTKAAQGNTDFSDWATKANDYTPVSARTFDLGAAGLNGTLTANFTADNKQALIQFGDKNINIEAGKTYTYEDICNMIK